MTTLCTYHCRSCWSCFTSLRAFDAHRTGSPQDRVCAFPDDAGLVEIPGGICRIHDPTEPRIGVTLYEHKSAATVREAFRAANGRQAASRKRKQGRGR